MAAIERWKESDGSIEGRQRHSSSVRFFDEPDDFYTFERHYKRGHYLMMDGSRAMALNPEDMFEDYAPQERKKRPSRKQEAYLIYDPTFQEKLSSQVEALTLRVRAIEGKKPSSPDNELAELKRQIASLNTELSNERTRRINLESDISQLKAFANEMIRAHNSLVAALNGTQPPQPPPQSRQNPRPAPGYDAAMQDIIKQVMGGKR